MDTKIYEKNDNFLNKTSGKNKIFRQQLNPQQFQIQSNISDKDLYRLCKEYGSNAKLWSRKFSALLPEVLKRHLYKKYGFYSIFEFAAKLAGLSQKTVEEVLRTYNIVENKPLLKNEIEKVGWGKVRAVTSLIENVEEEKLVDMVENLPKQALEEWVKELKKQKIHESEAKNSLFKTEILLDLEGMKNQENKICQNSIGKNDPSTFPPGWEKGKQKLLFDCENPYYPTQKTSDNSEYEMKNKWTTISFKISPEIEFQLKKFQKKLEKERHQSVGFNDVIKALLEKEGNNRISGNVGSAVESVSKNAGENAGKRAGENIGKNAGENIGKRAGEDIGKRAGENAGKRAGENAGKRAGENIGKNAGENIGKNAGENINKSTIEKSRHVKISIKKRALRKAGGKCSFPNCNNPAEILHHPERFALKKSHENIVPLCKMHHQIAHAGLIQNEENATELWRIIESADKFDIKNLIDKKVMEHWRVN